MMPCKITAETRRRGVLLKRRRHYKIFEFFLRCARPDWINSASPRLRGDIAKFAITALISVPIRFYKAWISPLLGPGNCRYHPTCSTYALQALKIHGPAYGSFLAIRRILSCHAYSRRPFHDPVPEAITPRIQTPNHRE